MIIALFLVIAVCILFILYLLVVIGKLVDMFEDIEARVERLEVNQILINPFNKNDF